MHFDVNSPNIVYEFGGADIKAECDIKDLGVLLVIIFRIHFIATNQ